MRCGLKWRRKRRFALVSMSLPAWGAWIEISVNSTISTSFLPHPAWEAWVETGKFTPWNCWKRSFPVRGRGLKLAHQMLDGRLAAVAPCTGARVETGSRRKHCFTQRPHPVRERPALPRPFAPLYPCSDFPADRSHLTFLQIPAILFLQSGNRGCVPPLFVVGLSSTTPDSAFAAAK